MISHAPSGGSWPRCGAARSAIANAIAAAVAVATI